MNKPKWSHYQTVVRVLRYIKGTMWCGVLSPTGVKSDSKLICYSDSDCCGDRVDRICTSGYFLKYLGGPISWCSKKKPKIALSICKAKYIVGALFTCKSI